MAVSGIAGTSITGTLSDGNLAVRNANDMRRTGSFMSFIKEAQEKNNVEDTSSSIGYGLSSSQVSRNHRLNGDYTQGFYDYYTSEADKKASPEGMAANVKSSSGKKIVIDKTSELYAQSKELENYMVKMLVSSMRETIHHSNLTGGDNNYARDMYEDMMYDNYAEQLTKNTHLGLADQIYIELSGQR